MKQVIENVESTKRQYALRGRATPLGWRDDQIIVIDSDQGESGASAAWREGFQRLVTDVGMGRAGIVMGLEVSRLARNNADWQRLLEICALTETLILDEDGVNDPTAFNDRLLLGLKGTMSEAELHVLKARLRGGILNKVRRGEYRCPLPTGFVYDEAGQVVLDPDRQIRETIAYFFETFSRVGSACQGGRLLRGRVPAARRCPETPRPRARGGLRGSPGDRPSGWRRPRGELPAARAAPCPGACLRPSGATRRRAGPDRSPASPERRGRPARRARVGLRSPSISGAPNRAPLRTTARRARARRRRWRAAAAAAATRRTGAEPERGCGRSGPESS